MTNTFTGRFHSGSRVYRVAEKTIARHFGADDAGDARPRIQPDADGYRNVGPMRNTEALHSVDQI